MAEYPVLKCTCPNCGAEWIVLIARYEFSLECPECKNTTNIGLCWGGLRPWPLTSEGTGANTDPATPSTAGSNKPDHEAQC